MKTLVLLCLAFITTPIFCLQGVAEAAQSRPNDLDEKALMLAEERHPYDGGLWFSLGVVRAKKGENVTAIAAFQRSLPLLSNKLPAYTNIIALELMTHDFVAALPICRKALAAYSADTDIQQNCAYAFSKESKYLEALVPLRSLKQARPTDVTVRVALISALCGADYTTECAAELEALFASSLLSRDQAHALAHDLSGIKAYHEAQQTNAYITRTWPSLAEPQPLARSDREKPDQTSSDPAQAQLSAAIVQATTMIRREHYVDAMHFLDEARRQFPDQPSLEYDAALTDVCLQRLPEAISILERLKQQEPPQARVEFLLGGSHEIQGDEAEAESSYREAIRLEPNNFIYNRVLAELLQRQGQLSESFRLLQRALALEPEDSQTLVLYARALEKQGAIEQATFELEHAVRSDPNSLRAHAALAQLYFRQRRIADAKEQQAAASSLESQRIKQWTIWGTAPNDSN